MASADLIVTHIDSALHELVYIAHASRFKGYNFRPLRLRLRNLKRFVQICAKEGGSASLLVWIEETIQRNAENILDILPRNFSASKGMVFKLEGAIVSIEERTDEFYQTPRSSSSCSPDNVLDSFSSISEAILDVQSTFGPPEFENLQETVEALEEQLSFVKRLVRYLATRLSVESSRELLAHSEYLTIHASCMLFAFKDWEGFELKISVFLIKMMPVYETCTQALSRSKLSADDDDDGAFIAPYLSRSKFIAMEDFLDSLISNLWDMLRLGTWQLTLVHDLQELYGGLRSLKTGLKKQESVKLKEDIGDAVCDAGVFICSLHHKLQTEVDLELLKNLFATINTILSEIEAREPEVPVLNFPGQEDGIKEDVLKVSPQDSYQGFEAKEMPSEGTSLSNEETDIVDQLTRGSERLRIVAIVGMPGLGKTTLAMKVYNNVFVTFHFHVRLLCSVSHIVNKKNVLLDLLRQNGSSSSKCSQTSSEQDLADALRKSLKGRKYLIFLDDMGDFEAWTLLTESFPDDGVGSRIILTSRRHDVVPHDLMVNGTPYFLRLLNQEESLVLLQSKLSFWLSVDVGMKVADKCFGLPLLIVIVAGVLKHAEPEGWDELLDRLSNVSIAEQCRNTLELMYKQLPDCVRPCLLYFGTFQDNKEVSVQKLIRLWIAEGFIPRDDASSLVEAAKHLLNQLIGRSLIMVAKETSLGGAKECQVHDLIFDFCVQKAKDEHFFHFLRGRDELSAFNEPHDLQRLCIHSEAEHFKQSRLFCPRARSLILNSSESREELIEGLKWRYISSAFCIFKRLRVLDLERVHFGCRFPSEIQQLVQLTFLAILSEVCAIPSWIGNLSNLETLIIQGDSEGLLPDSLWNLQKLQCLILRGSYYSLPVENLDNSSTLNELDSISGVAIPYSMMRSLLEKFPNTRKLSCYIRYSKGDGRCLVFPNILSRIQSISVCADYNKIFEELTFPVNLKKLMLGGFRLSSRNISIIGELPNLEVFKLFWPRLEGEIWEMKEGEFSKLKALKLVGFNVTKWSADDNQLDCLKKLVLEDCAHMKEVPTCLDSIPTLEAIEVINCSEPVIDMVRGIGRRREELMGDSGVKITINNASIYPTSEHIERTLEKLMRGHLKS